MSNIPKIVLVAHVVFVHGKKLVDNQPAHVDVSLDHVVEKLVDKLFDPALKLWHLFSTDLDHSTLGKKGSIKTSHTWAKLPFHLSCSPFYAFSSPFPRKITTAPATAPDASDHPVTPAAGMLKREILLGTGSATRKAIITSMGFTFEVVKAEIDERALGDRRSDKGVKDLVLLLANAKADAIIEKLVDDQKKTILLTADQVVTHKGKVLEKPLNKREAHDFISSYGSAPCSTVGSCVLTDLVTGIRVQGVDTTTIHFKPIPEDTITALVEEGEVFYCAGGLMVEHALVRPYIERIDGTMESVMGLSPELVERLWTELQTKLAQAR